MSDTSAENNATESNNANSRIEQDRQMINDAAARGTGPKLWAYTKLSGPGWLQSAITLGGGSLAGGLYLGVLAGYGLMWLQPLAMILGVVMLSAIGYVALSTNERPFDSINKHINPVLGWGWAIATLMANLVWCMPQFSLGTAALQQNLAPDILGVGGAAGDYGKHIIVAGLFVLSGLIVWSYDSGNWGIKLFEGLLKLMVAGVIICFFGVVVTMSLSESGLQWGEIFTGFIPNFDLLNSPAPAFGEVLSETGSFAAKWSAKIVSDQQKVMITAAATAVGINMTFLLPYSMLQRGWDKDFRGLAIFDLSTGLFIPFLLATGCIVIASASQFHATEAPGLVVEVSGKDVVPAKNLVGGYTKLLNTRLVWEEKYSAEQIDNINKKGTDTEKTKLSDARKSLPLADRRMAAMLVKRDAFNLAKSLESFTKNSVLSQVVFGIGVLGMAVSSIIILMLINGFVFCEMLRLPHTGMYHRIGCFMPAVTGAIGSFYWSGDAKAWMAVPTSMFGMVLLPIAYFTFTLMMNSKSLLGDNRPTGGKRVCWNILMGTATLLAAFGSFWSIKTSGPYATLGYSLMGGFVVLIAVGHIWKLEQKIEELAQKVQRLLDRDEKR